MIWFLLPPLLWLADWIWTLRLEWTLNEQYAYGWFVPGLAAYVLWSRWQDRPAVSLRRPTGAAVILGLWLLIRLPLGLILGANPDWRLALWAHTLLTLAAGLAWLARWGGGAWVRHFGPALALLLLAVPWPSGLENTLVNELMHGIAGVTVTCMNWTGTFAEQHGNLIRLTSGWVGVEEACSGVRSLQSTLMASVFLGELFRWNLPRRLLLVALGAVLSLVLNFGRTLTLTLVTVNRGPEAMGVVHDPVGHAVSIGAFAGLFGFAWWLHRRRTETPPAPLAIAPLRAHQAATEARWTAAVVLALGLAHLGTWAWYRPQGRPDRAETVALDWTAEPRAAFRDISPTVRALLRYSEGTEARWAGDGRTQWTVFFFHWAPGRISSFAGVHRPDICLPSAGFQLIERLPPLEHPIGSRTVAMEHLVFSSAGRRHDVFFAVWDAEPGRPVPLAATAADRLRQVWHRQRIEGRYSLQCVLSDTPSVEYARQQVAQFLERAVKRSPQHAG